MLRDQSQSKTFDRNWSSARRWLTAFSLVGLTIGLATLRGPARGAEDGPPSVASAEAGATEPRDKAESLPRFYLREGTDGVAIVRPAAASRHRGLERVIPLIGKEWEGEFFDSPAVANHLKIDMSRPGFVKLRGQDIEWVTTSVTFGKNGTGDKTLHSIMFSCPTVRMVAPFDWLAFLRQWRCECEEVRTGRRSYYKVKGAIMALFGRNPCVFLPDDRTIVLDEEAVIRKVARGEIPERPAFLSNPSWDRANRGLFAIAVKNEGDLFAKHYDLGRPDDAITLSLFKGIDSWILSVDDADDIVLHADAACRNRDASAAVSRSLESLIAMGRQALERDQPKMPKDVLAVRMYKGLLAGVRVEHSDNAITVKTQDFGTLADFAAIVEGQFQEEKAQDTARNDDKTTVKR